MTALLRCFALLALLALLMGTHCGSCPDLPESGNLATGRILRGTIQFPLEADTVQWQVPSSTCWSAFSSGRLMHAETQPIGVRLDIGCEIDDLPEVVTRAGVQLDLPDLRDHEGTAALGLDPGCEPGTGCAHMDISWVGFPILEPGSDPSAATLELTVLEASGTRAPYPDNVTDDFFRQFELRARFPATWRPAVEVTIEFVQHADDYRNGWDYGDLTSCEIDEGPWTGAW